MARARAASRGNGRPCSLRTLLESLDPETAEDVKHVIYDRTVLGFDLPERAAADAILEEYPECGVTFPVVSRHRRKECRQCR